MGCHLQRLRQGRLPVSRPDMIKVKYIEEEIFAIIYIYGSRKAV